MAQNADSTTTSGSKETARGASRAALLAAVLALLTSASTFAQGEATNRIGVTLWEEGMTVGVSGVVSETRDLFDGSDEVFDPADTKTARYVFATNFSYGLSKDTTIGLSFPYVITRRRRTVGGIRVKEGDAGLGDVSLLLKRRILRLDRERGTTQVSLIGGLQLPTGGTSETDSTGTLLPPSLQTGSGSVDFLFAAAVTHVMVRWVLNGSLFYQLNTEGAQDTKPSDIFATNVTLSWRFFQEEFPGPEAGVSAGALYEWAGPAELDGARIPDTGGRTLSAVFGVFFAPRANLVFRFKIQEPVRVEVNGTQPGLDRRYFFGFVARF